MTTFIARFYSKGEMNTPLSEAFDFKWVQGSGGPDLLHVGGDRPLDPKMIERIRPELEAALHNFRVRFKNVFRKPSRVVISHEISEV